MAVQLVKVFTSDLSGTQVEENQIAQVRFGYQGRAYVMDLTQQEAADLERLIRPYVDAAAIDTAPPKKATTKSTARKPAGRRNDLRYARAWLQDNGYKIGDRGRIPRKFLEAYETRTPAH